MRIVMLTDDGRSVDRRILLEAETLADLGHEVVIIARNEAASGVVADRIGRAKALWIDHDLGYLAGSRTPVELPPEQEEAAAPQPADAFAVPEARKATGRILGRLRTHAVAAYLGLDRRRRRADSVLLAARPWLGDASVRGVHWARLRFGVARMDAMRVALSAAMWPFESAIALKRRRRLAASVEAVATSDVAAIADPPPEAFEMNIWEKALFHRAVYFDPDIIHAHDLPQLLPAVLAGRELGVPVIYDAHEVYPEIATLTKEQQEQLRLKESALVHHCAEKITVNPFCARFMEERYRCRPFDVIMNATNPSPGFVRGQSDDRLRVRLGLSRDARILMFQGWMADVGRGLLELVAGMAAVRNDVHLVMMGYGDVELFRTAAANAGVASRVHILPPVPWDELVSWSAAADVGVIPYQPVDFNHRVCSPNKLFEFISAGLPILANDLPFLTEVIEGQGFGITRKMETPAEMGRAINEMFDPEKRHVERARANLLARASQWEWPVEAEKLKAAYARVTALTSGDPHAAARSPGAGRARPLFATSSLANG